VPTTIFEEGLIDVANDGVCFVTVRSSHELLTLLLLTSPPYVALNAKLPADVGVTEVDVGTELPAPTVRVEIEVGVPAHAPLLKNA